MSDYIFAFSLISLCNQFTYHTKKKKYNLKIEFYHSQTFKSIFMVKMAISKGRRITNNTTIKMIVSKLKHLLNYKYKN